MPKNPAWERVRAGLKAGAKVTGDMAKTAGKAAVRGLAPGAYIPQALQTGIGLAEGVTRFGMPKLKDDAFVFEPPPGELPRAAGQAVFLPKGSDEATASHEMRHASQSAWMPNSALLGAAADAVIPRMTGVPGSNFYLNPLEVDAYSAQPQGQQRSDDMNTISMQAEQSPALARLLRAYMGSR